MSDNKSKNQNLKHNKILYESRLIFGVPSQLFIISILLVIAVFIVAGFIPGIVIFFVFIPPLVIVHKKDEKGLYFLIDKCRRPAFYSAGAVETTALKTIEKKGDQFILKDMT